MKIIRTERTGYTYVETCTITNIKNDDQNNEIVNVSVDGSYYISAEIRDGKIAFNRKQSFGRSYGFSILANVLAKCLETINLPQQVKDVKIGNSISVIINEADPKGNRIDVLLNTIIYKTGFFYSTI